MKPQRWGVGEVAVLERARRGVVEFGLMSTLFALYYATRGIAAGKQADAFANAHDVMDLERRLGLFREIGVQTWVLAEPTIVRFLNFVYTYTHMTALILFVTWVFLVHHARYREIRNVFLGLLASGLLIYAVFPLAPPRFFPYTGFVDTLALYSGVNYDQPSVAMLYNPFAAMPSLHVAFALFVGIGLVRIGRRLLHWLIGLTYPLLMIAAVVGTGNHYILDVIAGSFLTGSAYLLVPRIPARVGRLRRQRALQAAGQS